jgi:hypothetical protein
MRGRICVRISVNMAFRYYALSSSSQARIPYMYTHTRARAARTWPPGAPRRRAAARRVWWGGGEAAVPPPVSVTRHVRLSQQEGGCEWCSREGRGCRVTGRSCGVGRWCVVAEGEGAGATHAYASTSTQTRRTCTSSLRAPAARSDVWPVSTTCRPWQRCKRWFSTVARSVRPPFPPTGEEPLGPPCACSAAAPLPPWLRKASTPSSTRTTCVEGCLSCARGRGGVVRCVISVKRGI